MIFDCFIFYNEFDILDIRLEELDPVVDKFLIVEADKTFQGTRKPFYFDEAYRRDPARYARFRDKLIVHNTYFPESITDPWQREYYQRNCIGPAIAPMAKPDDIILVSDADEIPRRKVVADLNPDPIQGIELEVFYYGLNVLSSDQHTTRAVRWHSFTAAQEIRQRWPVPLVEGGWHFSYLGDADHIANKFKAFSHTELNRSDTTDPRILRTRMKLGQDLWGDGHVYDIVPIDDTWPELVKDDPDRWDKFTWKR